MRKGEIACDKQFLLFSPCFLPNTALIFHFKCTSKCSLQFVSIWTSLKFCCLVKQEGHDGPIVAHLSLLTKLIQISKSCSKSNLSLIFRSNQIWLCLMKKLRS